MDGSPEFPDFSDAPLFREMERVLRAGSGPVNWELARQVAVALAPTQSGEPEADPDDAALEEAVRVAELHIGQATGMEPPPGMATAEGVDRHQWVESAVATLTGCLEPAAAAMSEALGSLMPEAAGPMAMFREQLGSLMVGAQAGTAIGQRSKNALAAWDLAVPPVGADHLRFVVPNISALASEHSLDVVEVRQWVALREVALRPVFARPWLRERFVDVVTDYAGSIRVDTSQMQERMSGVDPTDPEAMQRLLGGDEPLFSLDLDDEGRIKLARVQSLVAAIEGYVEHTRQHVADRLLASGARMEQAAREGHPTPDPVLGLFGVEVTAEHLRLGRDFCDRVGLEAGEPSLSRMWGDVESLPSMVELEEPMLWMARSL